MPKPHRVLRRIAGWLFIGLAFVCLPTCWVVAGVLHAQRCGVGLSALACSESISEILLHQALVVIGVWGAVFLAAVGFELHEDR